MLVDLVVKGGHLLLPGGIVDAGIGCEDGKIVSIAKEPNLPDGEQVVHADGLLVMPGLVDVHVHFKDPGFTYKDDFGTASLAAAHGGVTTVLEMPSTVPRVTTPEIFREKAQIVGSKARVDFGLYGVVMEENLDQIEALAEAGVIAFKIYLALTTTKTPPITAGPMLDALSKIAKLGVRAVVHAEDNDLVNYLVAKYQTSGRTDPLAHVDSRPTVAESIAIYRAIRLAQEAGCPLHIAHLSSGEGLKHVAQAKAMGTDVSVETCPHYLLLNKGLMADLGTILKINPPIREKEDQEALWRGIDEGIIDVIASDHSPHAFEEKKKENVWEAMPGFCGVETILPLMLTEVSNGRLSLEKLLRITSERPAQLFNLYPQKGVIGIDSDCDLTIVDTKKDWIITSDALHSKTKVTPFDKRSVRGALVRTILRGKTIVEDGVTADGSRGRLLKPLRY